MKVVRSGEFAQRAGVTVRTLRYYDRIGLLKPAAYSESGQRLYSETDYARLQQILTLKFIGLSLDDIRHLLTTDRAEIESLLERQKRALTEQAARLNTIIQTIERAQNAMRTSNSPEIDLDHFIQIIKAVNMNMQRDWLDDLYTDEQKAQLAALNQGRTLALHRVIGQSWKTLFADIQANLDTDVTSPTAQNLLQRWDELMTQLTGGDADLAAALNQNYAQMAALFAGDSTSPEVEAWTASIQSAAQFIQKARQTNSHS